MKAIVIILAVSVVAVLGAFTDEQKVKLRAHKESCINETGVDPIAVENAKRGEIDENDEKLACFFNCLLLKTGILSADGSVNWDVIRAKVPPSISKDQLGQLTKCQNIDGSGCQKAAKIFKCVLAENKTFTYLLQ